MLKRLLSLNAKAASLLTLLASSSLILLIGPRRIVDDAYIVYRYSYNLRTYGSYVFNLGERVEACTDFLWVILVALGSFVTDIREPNVAMFLAHALLIFTFVRIWQLSACLGISYWVGMSAALLLVFSRNYVYSSTNGLESALFGALLIEMIYRWQSDQFSLAFLCGGLLFWTRPEAAILSPIMAAAIYWDKREARPVFRGLLIWFAMTIGLTLFRWFYFHELVPNSVIAKSFPLELLIERRGHIREYFEQFCATNPQFVILLVAGAWALIWKRKEMNRKELGLIFFCLTSILFSFAVVVRNGGDWMPSSRLLVQYGVIYTVIFILLCKHRLISTAMITGILALGLSQHAKNISIFPHPEIRPWVTPSVREFTIDIASQLQGTIQPTDRISIGDLGYFSYEFKKNPIHDPLGLAEPLIAKHGSPRPTLGKSDHNYTYGVVKPEYIISGTNADWWNRIEKEHITPYVIFQSPQAYKLNEFREFVLVRRDIIGNVRDTFQNWPRVTLEELRQKRPKEPYKKY